MRTLILFIFYSLLSFSFLPVFFLLFDNLIRCVHRHRNKKQKTSQTLCSFFLRFTQPQPNTLSMTTTTTTRDGIDAHDNNGRTKLYHAAETGDVAEVARLLELKVDCDKFVRCHVFVDNGNKSFLNASLCCCNNWKNGTISFTNTSISLRKNNFKSTST